MSETVFTAGDDGRFQATELARGPWDPAAQHGGAPAALLMRAFELTEPSGELMLARVTYEFVRPVPLGELEVSASLVRPGRRAQLLEGTVLADGREVVRARALRVIRTSVDDAGGHGVSAPPPPRDGRVNDYPNRGKPMFATDAMEIRFVQGAFLAPGPAAAWFRLRVPLLEGEAPTPLQRLAAAADFGNGIGAALSWEEHVFINPDLTLYLEREPRGEWICLRSETRVVKGGIGIAESELFDVEGRVGRAVQALVVANR